MKRIALQSLHDIDKRATKRQKIVTDLVASVDVESLRRAAEEKEEMKGKLFESIRTAGLLKNMTNFEEPELRNLWITFSKYADQPRRGPKPIYSSLDSLVILLMLYKTGETLQQLSVMLECKYTTLRDAVVRTRRDLNLALRERWWVNRRRPQPIDDRDYEGVGLLVDSNSQEIYRPVGPFVGAKICFDVKNHIYACKKEVAVLATAPHYALFSAPAVPGSVHDYDIHKANAVTYAPYLLKTPERTKTTRDRNTKWGILGDCAYTGPEADTPDIRRLSVTKPSSRKTPIDHENGQKLAKLRVPVEQFFGRMEKAWAMTANIYGFDRINFDTDYDNCVLLTNELIKNNQLDEIDYRFHWALYDARRSRHEDLKLKQRLSQKKFADKQKLLSAQYAALPPISGDNLTDWDAWAERHHRNNDLINNHSTFINSQAQLIAASSLGNLSSFDRF